MAVFDGLTFDGAVFDIGQVSTRQTKGGWVKLAPTQSPWGPNDQRRGADWIGQNIGQQAWAPNDQSRGSEWTARPKGTGFN